MFVIAIGLYALSSFHTSNPGVQKNGFDLTHFLARSVCGTIHDDGGMVGHKLLSKPGGSAIQTEIQ